MENSIYLALSRQMTLQTNMDIVANNIANMNTTGYRGQNLIFEEFISDPRHDAPDGVDDPLSFVWNKGQYDDTSPGSVSVTGNSLDVSLDGPGFLGIQGPGGQINYTRAGDFQLSAEGILASSAGFAVAGAGGGNIVIPPGSSEVKIDEKGVVSNQDGQLGQLMLVEFENLQKLEPLGDNMYKTDAAPIPPANTRVKQGTLEGSNVNSVVEVTRMIETLRDFQATQNILKTENERLRGAIQKLTGSN